MIYWKLHIGDWSKSTVHLSPTDVGCYIRLLNYYYEKEAPLPVSWDHLFRICGSTTAAERTSVRRVATEFFVDHSDGWYHDRANIEIAKAHAKSESRAAAAEARWGRQLAAGRVK